MVPAAGEPIWDTTLKVLYMGDGATTGGVTAEGSAYALLASSISDGDTTHAPDGNSVFDALALKAPLISPSFTTPALGTPSGGTLTSCTGLPQAGVTGLTTSDSPVFATVKCSNITDGYIPKHTSDAVGLADSPIFIYGTNVGIATTTAAAPLQVGGQGQAWNGNTGHIQRIWGVMPANVRTGQLTVLATDAQAADKGGVISFGGQYSTAYSADWALIGGLKENSTDGDTAGYMVLGTRANGTTILERMRITSAGNIIIGATSGSYSLTLNSDSAGKPGVGGLWTVVSDERIKKDIVQADLDRCLEIVKSVPLKRFSWGDGVYNSEQVKDKSNLGWIAQDVQKVFPKAINSHPFIKADHKEIIEDCLDMNGGQMIAAMYGCLQKSISVIEDLQARIAVLENGKVNQ